MTAFYRVEHETEYEYAASVSTSQLVACLRPRVLPYQRVAWSDVEVKPLPARSGRRDDYFGNPVDHFTVLKPHAELTVAGRSLVEVDERPRPDPETSRPWEGVRDALVYRKGVPAAESSPFVYASTFVERDPMVADFAGPSFPPGRPLLAGAVELMHRIHSEFRFDAESTTIATPVRKVLADKRGVCQDFAHLQISCLRSLGLPARYVSGYLLTDPPPGKERLVGADASHAWLAAYCPVLGWVDLDPTNDVLPSDRHVTLAWGRDYADVSPLRGVILGGAHHTLEVGVSVTPLDAVTWAREVANAGRRPVRDVAR